MVVFKLKGGLGNQLFQYAFGRAIAAYRKDTLYFDLSYLLNASSHNTQREFQLGGIKEVKLTNFGIATEFNSFQMMDRQCIFLMFMLKMKFYRL